jgi:L-methionine (R)-S-oxide reductase
MRASSATLRLLPKTARNFFRRDPARIPHTYPEELYSLQTMHTLTPAPSSTSKREFYQHLCEQLGALLADESDFTANAANTAALLFHSLPDINWAGFYLTRGEELVLGPFQGKPACVRIPFGKGVCGTSAATAEPIVVPDVDDFPGHIACDNTSRSEVVVPLLSWGRVLGVLDLDSPSLNRFDEEDCEGLESVVSILLAAHAGGDHFPDLAAEADQQSFD